MSAVKKYHKVNLAVHFITEADSFDKIENVFTLEKGNYEAIENKIIELGFNFVKTFEKNLISTGDFFPVYENNFLIDGARPSVVSTYFVTMDNKDEAQQVAEFIAANFSNISTQLDKIYPLTPDEKDDAAEFKNIEVELCYNYEAPNSLPAHKMKEHWDEMAAKISAQCHGHENSLTLNEYDYFLSNSRQNYYSNNTNIMIGSFKFSCVDEKAAFDFAIKINSSLGVEALITIELTDRQKA